MINNCAECQRIQEDFDAPEDYLCDVCYQREHGSQQSFEDLIGEGDGSVG